MEITPEQFAKIEHCLPTQRGNVSLSNVQVVNAILYVAEHGCKWRGLPKRFGNWHTIYTRMNRWTKSGVLDRMFEECERLAVPPCLPVIGAWGWCPPIRWWTPMHSKSAPRRRHSAELKTKVLSACDEPGASISGIALAHGL